MYKKLKKNDSIIQNQLRSKLLQKNLFSVTEIPLVNLQLNLNKLKSFNDTTILEGLFLVEFLSSLKGAITYYKKMYQEVNVQVGVKIRNNYIFYFLFLLKLFYFPILVRRNESLISTFDKQGNYMLTISNINMIPFVPDIYFK